MTPSYHALLCKGGYLRDKKAAECAVSMVLSSEPSDSALCEIADIKMLYRPTEEEKQQALSSLCTPDTDIRTPSSDLFGVSYTKTALDLYAAAHTIADRRIVLVFDEQPHYTLIALNPARQ